MSESDHLQTVAQAALIRWKRRGERHTLPIEGYSMWPLLQPGDTIAVMFGNRVISRGQIIVFQQNERLVVHRVRTVNAKGQLVTRGDNGLVYDPPIESVDVLGIVVARERFGRNLSLTSTSGRLLSITYMLIAHSRQRIRQLARKLGLRRPSFLRK